MFICHTCALFHFNGDCSGTRWTAARAEEIAVNLRDVEIMIGEEPHFVMEYCSGCGERGIDAYPARYYDDEAI